MSREELLAADEVFMTGTSIEVLPVIRIDGKPVGSGAPGPTATKLQAAYRERIAAWLAAAPR